jgi:hypothetical protein
MVSMVGQQFRKKTLRSLFACAQMVFSARLPYRRDSHITKHVATA